MEGKPHVDHRRKESRNDGNPGDGGTGRRGTYEGDEYRGKSWSRYEKGDSEVPEEKPRRICMEPRGHAQHLRKCHSALAKRGSREKAHIVKEKSLCTQEEQGHHGRS